MKARHPRRLFAAVGFSFVIGSAPVRAQPPQVQPQVGQPGKDVVWVPTVPALVEKMLDLAQVTTGDYVIDLGSGDGRTVIAAAKRGAHALGVEYERAMVDLSRRRAAEEGVDVAFVQGDLFDADLSKATVVTMFLLPQLNLRLRPRLLDLEPGTRIVSNTFTMGDWVADEQAIVRAGCDNWCTALLWIVPAKVEGAWRTEDGLLTLRQQYQMLDGTLTAPDGTSKPLTGKLRGAQIILSVNDQLYEGRVQGNAISGTATAGGVAREWAAARGPR